MYEVGDIVHFRHNGKPVSGTIKAITDWYTTPKPFTITIKFVDLGGKEHFMDVSVAASDLSGTTKKRRKKT